MVPYGFFFVKANATCSVMQLRSNNELGFQVVLNYLSKGKLRIKTPTLNKVT